MSSHDSINATRKALALLAHAVAATTDARIVLANLMSKYRAQMRQGTSADAFDEMATGMLLAVSSLALKQHPDDPEVQQLYRDLRPGNRH